MEIVGLPTARGAFPVPDKGQFPMGKRGAKATQNGDHDLVHSKTWLSWREVPQQPVRQQHSVCI